VLTVPDLSDTGGAQATTPLTASDLADACRALENAAPPVPDLSDTGGANATTPLTVTDLAGTRGVLETKC
jgi:hypothetical protein